MKTIRVSILLCGCWLLSTLAVWATPLGLVAGPDAPTFTESLWDVSYDAGSGSFQVINSDIATLFYQNGPSAPDGLTDFGSFSLTATINSLGFLTGGTFSVSGGINGGEVHTLLTGTLLSGPDGQAFGSWSGAGAGASQASFEFLFTVTGGDPGVVSDFGTGTGGIILNADFTGGDTAFNGGWTTSFASASGNGNGVVFAPVPEPSSFALLTFALAAVAAARCRRCGGRRVSLHN